MSRELDSPVQTQMAVAIFKSPLREYRGSNRHEGRQFTGRRRVFVQTETGCVLDMELDRSDNVHTVKRRLQVALNVPTDESSLSFGDLVLKNDLSAVRHDSPLLLTRNLMHRSSSTPCLSPTGRDLQQKDKSGLIEIVGESDRMSKVKPLVKDTVKAIKIGVDPIPANGGLGGAYYFRNSRGDCIAIVKPTDEEPFAPNNPKGFVGKALGQPGLKRSVRVGETGVREVAAYLLDSDHFANVPPTALVKITHSIFNINDGVELIPIDHGLCLPETLEDPYFEWIHWPQASIPFSEDELKYIDELNPVRDCEMLRAELPMIREACLRVLHLCTIFLKEAAVSGLCLAEIGEMMSREFRSGEEEPSELELVCIEARRSIAERELLSPKADMGEEEFLFDIDYEESELDSFPKVAMDGYMDRAPFHFGIGGFGGGRNPLSKLDEAIAEEGESEEEEEAGKRNVYGGFQPLERIPSVSKLSLSLKNTTLGKKTLTMNKYPGAKQEESYMTDSSSGHRSANEQLPASVSFVQLADMNEEEWGLFLEKFQELLYPAFANRKSITLGQRQRQRLGTSCQF
ncbi:hypothetical protein CRG98_015168 [Punica granatum]|uniref:1-phosphatidylinositol 4-kinase n=1 Tax=Punica granatum TaxID=22663 RepID=A0A2I0K8J6_PUNGR|nr:hypothetical protein CRG98_015168 [Punica granatum]